MSNVLGRGLDALLNSQPFQLIREEEEPQPFRSTEPDPLKEENARETVRWLPICEIYPNAGQPRKTFNETKLQELTDSIKQNGVLQPIIVRKIDNSKYELVAGERRWRASQIAELENMPAIIREVNDNDVLKWALIENIQRDDLNPIEEAEAYQKLIQSHKLTQEDVAKMVSKKRSTITNSLRLLNLSINGRDALLKNEITLGHAKALLSLETAEDQDRFLREIKEKNWSVRDVERYVHTYKKKQRNSIDIPNIKSTDPFIAAIEAEIMDALGTKIVIHNDKKGGRIEVHYYSNEDLDRLRLMFKARSREVA